MTKHPVTTRQLPSRRSPIASLFGSAALSICLLACDQETAYAPPGLEQVSNEELLTSAYNFDYPDPGQLTLFSTAGDTLGLDSLERIAQPERYDLRYYKDAKGKIVAAVIHEASAEDKAFRQRLNEAINNGPELRVQTIDCSQQGAILQRVFEADQAIRTTEPYDRSVDHANLEIIVSLLEQCGMPTRGQVTEVQLAAIWAVLQHSPNQYRKKYLPVLEQAAERGDIGWTTIAMITDRIAMDDGQPQTYGTQVSRNLQTGSWELYPIADEAEVNRRRLAIGLDSLHHYLSRWDIATDLR